jgi:phosphoenolpyruvate-protein kinase (PTS system EI component)
VLRLIAAVTEAAGSRVRVALCGEIGSEATATPLLVGLGIHELSMSPPAIPTIKDAVRSLSATEARALARRAIDQHTAAGVRALLKPHHPT